METKHPDTKAVNSFRGPKNDSDTAIFFPEKLDDVVFAFEHSDWVLALDSSRQRNRAGVLFQHNRTPKTIHEPPRARDALELQTSPPPFFTKEYFFRTFT